MIDEDGTDACINPRKQSLCLAERIGEEHRCASPCRIELPPIVDACEDLRLFFPFVFRMSECAFGNECITFQMLEGFACGIGFEFVVAAYHPYLAVMLDADLRRTEDMPRRMQTDTDFTDLHRLAERKRLDMRALRDAITSNRFACGRHQITFASCAKMIGMAMSNNGTANGDIRINIKITERAVKTFGGAGDQGVCRVSRVFRVHRVESL